MGEITEGHLDNLKDRKVVEHNDLITSIAKMDKTPLKIFELAVSCIDTENPPKDNTVYLSKTELFAFFKVNDSNKHSRFKEAVINLHQQSIFQIREIDSNKKKYNYRVISPLEETSWNDYNDKITITFTKAIMPFLINLKKTFTQYALLDIINLNSKYSIIIYKWLSMFYNQYEHYKHKNMRTQKQLQEYVNPAVKLQELRELTDTVAEHSDFRNFEKWVLKKPIEEINSHTHFFVTYTKIKKGRSIESIEFHIEKKKLAQDMNGNYKKDQNDPQYLKSKEEKEQLKQKYFAQAMANPYTRMLNEAMLLFPHDLMDIETMANLQQLVYPLYDELKEKRGIEGVKTHMSYVSSKQDDYSKRNIAQYLKKSITSYLEAIKFKDELKK